MLVHCRVSHVSNVKRVVRASENEVNNSSLDPRKRDLRMNMLRSLHLMLGLNPMELVSTMALDYSLHGVWMDIPLCIYALHCIYSAS